MQAKTDNLQYADVNDDIVRSVVETGPKYYIALATAGSVTLLCFFSPGFISCILALARPG